jgi:hypothetical protein
VHLIDLYWLIIPSYADSNSHTHGPEHLSLSMFDILGFLGIFLVFLGFFMFVLNRQKLTPLHDPRFHESLSFENF